MRCVSRFSVTVLKASNTVLSMIDYVRESIDDSSHVRGFFSSDVFFLAGVVVALVLAVMYVLLVRRGEVSDRFIHSHGVGLLLRAVQVYCEPLLWVSLFGVLTYPLVGFNYFYVSAVSFLTPGFILLLVIVKTLTGEDEESVV